MRKVNLIGKKFGKLLVISELSIYVSPNGHRKRMWLCKCDCGNFCNIMGSHLTTNHTKSCGCDRYTGLKHRLAKDLSGYKFGKLAVIKRLPNRIIGNNSRTFWRCSCECGNKSDVLGLLLTGGLVKSCGCLGKSHSERNMADFLSKYNFEYETQYSFCDLFGVNNGLLKFDFAVFSNTNLSFLIELDGEQHYKPIPFFGGIDKYKIDIKNDSLKNKYCDDNNIPLIRINVSNLKTDKMFLDEYYEVFTENNLFINK